MQTAYASLQWLRNFKSQMTGKFEVCFHSEHRADKKHHNADAKSRRPTHDHEGCRICRSTRVMVVILQNPEVAAWAER